MPDKDQFSDAETEKRANDALKRMLNTPPQAPQGQQARKEEAEAVMLHPVAIKLKPRPTLDRLRIAIEVLLFGTVSFSGEITSLDGLPQHPALRQGQRP
jgi:hypothetical protein